MSISTPTAEVTIGSTKNSHSVQTAGNDSVDSGLCHKIIDSELHLYPEYGETRVSLAMINEARQLDAATSGFCKIVLRGSSERLSNQTHNQRVTVRGFTTRLLQSGAYQMNDHEQISTFSYPPSQLSKDFSADQALLQFENVLSDPSLLKEVEYRTDIDLRHKSSRQQLGLPSSPIWPLNGNCIREGKVAGIHWPYAYESGTAFGAPFAMHKEDFDFFSLNHLWRGKKCWIIIPPRGAELLEQKIKESDSIHYSSSCSQFLRHFPTFFPPSLLNCWGIPYKTIIQNEGEVVITYPGAYHQGFSCGYTLAEAVNFTDSKNVSHSYRECSPETCANAILKTQIFPSSALQTSTSSANRKLRKQNTKKRKADSVQSGTGNTVHDKRPKRKPASKEIPKFGQYSKPRVELIRSDSSISSSLGFEDPTLSKEEVNLLTSLYGAIASPYAFAELRTACKAARKHNDHHSDSIRHCSVSNILAELDKLDGTVAWTGVLRRILISKLATQRDRFKEEIVKADANSQHPQRRSSRIPKYSANDNRGSEFEVLIQKNSRSKAQDELMHWAYPDLLLSAEDFERKKNKLKERLRAGRNWSILEKRFSAALLSLIPSQGEVGIQAWR